jgi:hypothetical protein
MDDQAALIARRVAMVAAACLNAPADVEAYRRLAAAVGGGTPTAPRSWRTSTSTSCSTTWRTSRPTPLGEGVADLEAVLRRQARRQL